MIYVYIFIIYNIYIYNITYMLHIYIYIMYIYTLMCTHKHTLIRYTQVTISSKFQLEKTWRLMKAIAEMKLNTEQMMKLE